MANDRYCFLVLEESLPEGIIAPHRKSRSRADRLSRLKRRLRPARAGTAAEPAHGAPEPEVARS